MKKRMTVSEARAHLFDLVEYVTETPDSAVVIEHRDRKGRTVLVDESHYQQVPPTEFRLAGSLLPPEGEDDVDVVEMIEQIRKEQAALFEKKLDEIFADD